MTRVIPTGADTVILQRDNPWDEPAVTNEPFINVTAEPYGATGDGVTDDTNAISTASSAVGVGGTIVFPNGTYLVTGLSANIDNQHWELSRGAVIYLADWANDNIITVTADGFTLTGGKLDGNASNQSGTWGGGTYTGSGVKADSVTGLCVDGVEITSCKFMGIDVKEAARVRVTNNYIHTVNASCFHFRAVHGLICSGNHFYNWARDYTYLEEGDHAAPALSIYDGTTGSYDLVITSNLFTNTDAVKFAIESSGTVTAFPVSDAVISSNVFDSNGYAAGGISGAFFRCAMVGNVHKNGYGNHRSGYEVVGTDLIIADNLIEEGTVAIGSHDSITTARVSVRGNRVSNTATGAYAIWFGGSSGAMSEIAVTGNGIDLTGASGGATGIRIGSYGDAGVVTGVTVSDNVVKGVANCTGIRLSGAATSSDIAITGNRVSGCDQGVLLADDSNHDEVTIAGNDLRGNSSAISGTPSGGTYRTYFNITADNQTAAQVAADVS